MKKEFHGKITLFLLNDPKYSASNCVTLPPTDKIPSTTFKNKSLIRQPS